MMVGSHHALQLGCAPVQKDLDLSSVVILAPMGSAVHPGLKDELKRHFPNMFDVSDFKALLFFILWISAFYMTMDSSLLK